MGKEKRAKKKKEPLSLRYLRQSSRVSWEMSSSVSCFRGFSNIDPYVVVAAFIASDSPPLPTDLTTHSLAPSLIFFFFAKGFNKIKRKMVTLFSDSEWVRVCVCKIKMWVCETERVKRWSVKCERLLFLFKRERERVAAACESVCLLFARGSLEARMHPRLPRMLLSLLYHQLKLN